MFCRSLVLCVMFCRSLVLCVMFCRSLVLCVMFCSSLFVLLSFFSYPLCCLSFFDLRILITPLVSSNSSSNNRLELASTVVNIVDGDDSRNSTKCAEHTYPTREYRYENNKRNDVIE